MIDFKNIYKYNGVGISVLILGILALLFFGIDFIKAITSISIGSAIVIVFIVSFILFKKQWSDLINRIIKAGKGGVEFYPPIQNEVEFKEAKLTQGISESGTTEEVDAFMANMNIPIVIAEEESIKRDIDNFQLTDNLPVANAVLIRSLAAKNVELHF